MKQPNRFQRPPASPVTSPEEFVAGARGPELAIPPRGPGGPVRVVDTNPSPGRYVHAQPLLRAVGMRAPDTTGYGRLLTRGLSLHELVQERVQAISELTGEGQQSWLRRHLYPIVEAAYRELQEQMGEGLPPLKRGSR